MKRILHWKISGCSIMSGFHRSDYTCHYPHPTYAHVFTVEMHCVVSLFFTALKCTAHCCDGVVL